MFRRCLAHIVHLSAKHIVQAFSEHGPIMDSNISDIPTDDLPVDIDEDSETLYAPGDTVGKLWAFINQVCVFYVHDSLHRYYGVLGAALLRGVRVCPCRSSTRHKSRA